jgi:hypothetical protein
MSLNDDLVYALKNISNEGLYPLIEMMLELGWDPIQPQIQSELINQTEILFKFLYNNLNNNGTNTNQENSHFAIHEKLYQALKFSLYNPAADVYDDLLIRDNHKRNVISFTPRLHTILTQKPLGLKKCLTLYTEMYHLQREYKHSLIPPKPNSSQAKAIQQCQQNAWENSVYNAKQFRCFIEDKKYREILEKDLLHSDSQLHLLSNLIIKEQIKNYSNKTIEKINDYALAEEFDIIEHSTLQKLNYLIEKLIENFEDLPVLSNYLQQITSMDLVKNREKLRGYLGQYLAFKESLDQPLADILCCYDLQHELIQFKPYLAQSIADKIKSELLLALKHSFSSRIYQHDGLLETYIPASMKGIKTSDRILHELIFAYDFNGELTLFNGPINQLYTQPEGPLTLQLILEFIYNNNKKDNSKPFPTLDDLFKFDNNQHIIDLQDQFKQQFVEPQDNLHQLLIFMKLFEFTGLNSQIINLFKLPSMEAGINQLSCELYNFGLGDTLYLKLSNSFKQSIDLDLLLNRNDNKTQALSVTVQFSRKLTTKQHQLNLFIELILAKYSWNYYHIEQAVYAHQNIKTRQAIEYQALRNEFPMANEKNLFRNGIDLKQHAPAMDEYFNLQVGDSQGSNVSLTQIGDIATAYAVRDNKGQGPIYSWITIHSSQKAINCSHYMENNLSRIAAQEFSTGALNQHTFLGAIKVKIKKDLSIKHDEQRIEIVDGLVNQQLLEKFNDAFHLSLQKPLNLAGIEGQAKFFLHKALEFSSIRNGNTFQNNQLDSSFNYIVKKNPISKSRVRTSYQAQFDSLEKRKESLSPKRDISINHKPNFKKIPSNQSILLNRTNLRNYHQQHRNEQLSIFHENIGFGHNKMKRLANEKANIKQQHIFLNKIAPSSLSDFGSFEQTLAYIKNSLDKESLIIPAKFKRTKDKINLAIYQLFELDSKEATSALNKLMNNYIKNQDMGVMHSELAINIIQKINQHSSIAQEPELLKNNYVIYTQENKTGLEKYFNKNVNDDFLLKFAWTLEFIDTTNILSLLNSPLSPIQNSPWRLYQPPATWHEDNHLTTWQNIANNKYNLNVKGLNSLFEDLVTATSFNSKLNNCDFIDKMRSYPIIAGGGLDRQGQLIPAHILTDKSVCTQYFKISHAHLLALQSNEFIKVLDHAQLKKPTCYGADHVVQYRYVDLRDAQKLKKYYTLDSSLLTKIDEILNKPVPKYLAQNLWPRLSVLSKINDLSAHQFAELIAGPREYQELVDTYTQNLTDLNAYPAPGEREEIQAIVNTYQAKLDIFTTALNLSDDFEKLLHDVAQTNQALLHQLVTQVTNDKSLSAIERYRKLVSIHFFPDMNGRAMRLFYRQEVQRPLYFSNWDLDIIIPETRDNGKHNMDINQYTEQQFRKYVNLIGALKKEYFAARHSQRMPDYYASPDFWLIVFEINPKYYSPEKKVQLRNRITNFYMSDNIQALVEKKAYYDYMHLIMQHIFSWDEFNLASYMGIDQTFALHLAIEYDFNMPCLQQLLTQADQQHFDLLELINEQAQNPAHIAAINQNFAALSLLIEHSPLLVRKADSSYFIPYQYLLQKVNLSHPLTSDNLRDLTEIKNLLDQHRSFNHNLTTSPQSFQQAEPLHLLNTLANQKFSHNKFFIDQFVKEAKILLTTILNTSLQKSAKPMVFSSLKPNLENLIQVDLPNQSPTGPKKPRGN